jgi:outer membrane protein
MNVWMWQSKDRIAYVNTAKLYESFELKKELEKKLTEVQERRQKHIDSLALSIHTLSIEWERQGKPTNSPLGNSYIKKNTELRALQDKFSQDHEALVSSYQEQIWKQLNQYVKEFGEERGYDYLMGADGTGTLIYANSDHEVTKEAIEYVNIKYIGKSKRK